jgi:hypothetical protein
MGTFVLRRRALAKGTLGRSESPQDRSERSIAAGEAGFQPQRRLDQRDFTGGDKKRLAAPQKTIYNRRAWNGTCLVAARYFPYGLIFHFGWESVVSGRACAA